MWDELHFPESDRKLFASNYFGPVSTANYAHLLAQITRLLSYRNRLTQLLRTIKERETLVATLTAILYTCRAWRSADGGRLEMLDERSRCWWALPPVADTLVLFRSDRVLHRVAAFTLTPKCLPTMQCHVPSYAAVNACLMRAATSFSTFVASNASRAAANAIFCHASSISIIALCSIVFHSGDRA